ncbi:hypothetical protein [Romboutsia sp.]|uniref:hypothetical protein n=1 Tax=Romboutsia sp. TaxID=1965302 RepID=UPI003F4025DC
MIFECRRKINGELESWNGKIEYFDKSETQLELHISSRSFIHIIIGASEYGNFACIPNFDGGCYLSEFKDVFWNSERLTKIMGEVDGITAAKAIEFIDKNIDLWN